jgi:hypothetical protein
MQGKAERKQIIENFEIVTSMNDVNYNTLKYEKRLVAFIDILGFKEIIKQSEYDSSKVELIYSVLNYLKDWEVPSSWNLKLIEIEEDAQAIGVEKFEISNKTNSTSFSDSIVVSVRVDDNVNEMASTLIVNLAYIGAVLLEKGILCRGGLTLGNILHSDNGTVFGQGLIDAYFLENNNAKYPRIILSDKLIKELNYPLKHKRNRYPYHQYLMRFSDGTVGFHQLQYYQVIQSWIEMTPEMLTEKMDTIREVIIDGLDSSFERPEIFEKYKWLKEQYGNLIILDALDFETKKEARRTEIKKKLHELNESISRHNIHFSVAEDFYKNNRKRNDLK